MNTCNCSRFICCCDTRCRCWNLWSCNCCSKTATNRKQQTKGLERVRDSHIKSVSQSLFLIFSFTLLKIIDVEHLWFPVFYVHVLYPLAHPCGTCTCAPPVLGKEKKIASSSQVLTHPCTICKHFLQSCMHPYTPKYFFKEREIEKKSCILNTCKGTETVSFQFFFTLRFVPSRRDLVVPKILKSFTNSTSLKNEFSSVGNSVQFEYFFFPS